MIAKSTSRRGVKQLFLGLMLLAFFQLVIHPQINKLQECRTTFQALSVEKIRLQELITRQSVVTRQLESIERFEQQSGYFFNASTLDIATRMLIDRLHFIVESSGGQITSVEPLTSDTTANRIRLQILLDSDDALLLDLLHQLEGGQPLVIVDSLTIQARNDGISSNSTPSKKNLLIRLEVSGLFTGEPA